MRPSRIRDYEPADYAREKRYTIALIVIAFAIIFCRLIFLQIIKGNELGEKALTNAVRERSIMAVRGSIVDCHGEIIASNRPAYNLIYFPGVATDTEKMGKIFTEIFAPAPPPFSLAELTTKSGRNEPVRLVKNISRLHLGMVEARSHELPGVAIEVAPSRVYERGEAMAHVIGYVGEISQEEMAKDQGALYRMGSILGKKGIEKALDPALRGKDGAEQIEVNVKGKGKRVLGMVPPVAGHNVILNVDAQVQEATYRALGNRKGAAVMLDVNSGAVIAMVSTPSFDPNMFIQGISTQEWTDLLASVDHPLNNKAISGLYPPASTYKPFVAIAALEEGVVDGETTVQCRGSLEIGDNVFRCWKKEGHGRVNLHRAIVESCDVYFYNIARSLPVDTIAKYAKSFGFGSPTGVDMDGEKKGIVPTKDWKMERVRRPWMLGDTVSVAIGQGYNLATPLQLAAAYGAIANGGTLWRPRVVKKVVSVDGRVIADYAPEKRGEINISPGTMDMVRRGLWGVVNDLGGTGGLARMANMEVCGKTGTAQVVSMPKSEKGGKRKAPIIKDHALFAAYAPCKNPEVVVVVIVENAGHGGSMAAPVARRAIEAYFLRNKTKPGAQTL